MATQGGAPGRGERPASESDAETPTPQWPDNEQATDVSPDSGRASPAAGSDSDAEPPSETKPDAEHPTPRNLQAWLACALGASAFVLVLATGEPFGLFLGVFALSFGISAWVRVRRGMATVRRPAQFAVLLALASFALWVVWYYASLDCREMAPNPDELTRCVEDHTGLL